MQLWDLVLFGCNVLGFASSNPPTMYNPIISANGTQILWQKLVQGKPLIMGTGEIPVLKNISCPPQAGFSAALPGNACTFFSSLIFFKAKGLCCFCWFCPNLASTGQRIGGNISQFTNIQWRVTCFFSVGLHSRGNCSCVVLGNTG